MKTADVIEVLLRERPDGVSFDPMSVRLLRQLIPFEDGLIEELKDEMFQLGDRLWFSLDMIAANDVRLTLQKQVSNWLLEYPCFSVNRLFENYSGMLRHISASEHFAVFLRQLGFSVAEYGQGGFYAFRSASNLGESLASIAKSISEGLERADGMQALNEIEEMLPYLTTEALEDIRTKFLPKIHVEDVGGILCWRSAEAVYLPEDFTEKITEAIDTLVELRKKVDTGNLEFALDLFYRVPFRETYNLSNRRVFISTCAKNYKGTLKNKKDFTHEFIHDWTEHNGNIQISDKLETHSKTVSITRRHRSPNTRFDILGVPLGAQLVFTKGSHITCTVIDPINQVEYDGKRWAISKLAMHLLNGVVTNGFAHFSYNGEILLERRSRLEKEGETSGVFAEELPPSPEGESREKASSLGDLADVPKDEHIANCLDNINSDSISPHENHNRSKKANNQEKDNDSEIIGLEGRPLKPETWKAFKTAGTDPRVAKWVQRVENGERVKDIANESGYAVSTMNNMISGFKLYFKVCELNDIVPEACSDV